MITQSSSNNKLYAVWKKDLKTSESYLIIESEIYPLRLKLDTFMDTTGEQNIELIKNGVKELLSKFEICCRCCNQETIIDNIVSFLTDKSINYSTLKQWFTCRFEAVYE